MEITSTLGFVGLTAVVLIAIVVARLRRRSPTNRFVGWATSPHRSGSRNSTDWFGRDPLLFVGAGSGSADCSAGSDAGGGCD
jgi:hypothetical protein